MSDAVAENLSHIIDAVSKFPKMTGHHQFARVTNVCRCPIIFDLLTVLS